MDSIPVIDIAPFRNGSAQQQQAVAKDVADACASLGFLIVSGHGVADSLASMEAWTRRRGRDFGSDLAEGFRQYAGEPYPRSPLLQELEVGGEAGSTPRRPLK